MSRIQWNLWKCPIRFWRGCRSLSSYTSLCFRSLFYNHHLSQSYVSDVILEPLLWFVEHFAHVLGPYFVAGVILLTSTVVSIAYWIGLPYWWELNRPVTVLLLIIGNWLLLNVTFHYYKAATTPPGVSPVGELIANAASMCKKCLSPRPARVHHCSVCKKCILKMDHHCPWLNNCVGFGNHRYFYLYMVYTALGALFIMLFGVGIAYESVFVSDSNPVVQNWFSGGPADTDHPLEGHPVKVNATGHLIPVTDVIDYDEAIGHLPVEHDLPVPPDSAAKHKAIIFMIFIIIPTFLGLFFLSTWHGKMISRGETSIEWHINNLERKRFLEIGKVYQNPYDFGMKENWRRFLGLVNGRTFWRHVLLPSGHRPEGNGLTWETVQVEEHSC